MEYVLLLHTYIFFPNIIRTLFKYADNYVGIKVFTWLIAESNYNSQTQLFAY